MAQSPCICLQFGMLIAHLFDTYPNPEDFTEAAIGDLQVRKYMKSNCFHLFLFVFLFRCLILHCFLDISLLRSGILLSSFVELISNF